MNVLQELCIIMNTKYGSNQNTYLCGICKKSFECTMLCMTECSKQSILSVTLFNKDKKYRILPKVELFTCCVCKDCFSEYLRILTSINREHAMDFVDEYCNCFIGKDKKITLDDILVINAL